MKLFRYGEVGRERPGAMDATGACVDVSALVDDFDPSSLASEAFAQLDARFLARQPKVDLAGQRLGPPIARPGTIWCVGLNYVDHAQEAGMAIPVEPILFSKAVSALSGPNDAIPFDASMTKLDWEVELGVVIGRPAFKVAPEAALDHVLGYTIVNDISERGWQMERGGQWMKGKSHPGFCPVGPWLVTRDEISDPQDLHLWLDLNGTRRQDGTTASMIFPVAAIVSYISHFARLDPGDLICTGTPAGVGGGMSPPLFLGAGDRVTLGISGLGAQAQTVGT